MIFAALATCLHLVSALAANPLPCDIFDSHSTPCVVAHSVVRALYASYDGPLYQIIRTIDKQSINISTISAGGYADAGAQTAFCNGGDEHKNPTWAPWAPGICCSDSHPVSSKIFLPSPCRTISLAISLATSLLSLSLSLFSLILSLFIYEQNTKKGFLSRRLR